MPLYIWYFGFEIYMKNIFIQLANYLPKLATFKIYFPKYFLFIQPFKKIANFFPYIFIFYTLNLWNIFYEDQVIWGIFLSLPNKMCLPINMVNTPTSQHAQFILKNLANKVNGSTQAETRRNCVDPFYSLANRQYSYFEIEL